MSTSKRIVLVGPAHPYRGGIAHFMETMYHGLHRRGHSVSAVTFTRQYPSLFFPGRTQYEAAPADGAVEAPRLIDTLNPVSWYRAARRAGQDAPDVVVFQYWMPFFAPAFGTMARRLRRRGTRVLAVVHNALPHEPRPGDAALSRYFFRACDGCLVMSDAVADDLEALAPGMPMRLVPHPVYTRFGDPVPRAEARAALGLPADAPVLLFFGLVRRYKGLHVLLEALPRIVEALPETRLVVAGEFYDDEAPYRKQIAAHGLQAHVQVHPEYIPSREVAQYFSAADLVVQPYVSATQSGVAQVAFQFERPLVVTDVGGLAEAVPHERAGLVVPPEDPAALAGAVVRFFEDGLAEALADGIRAQKRRYSWEAVYDAVEALATGVDGGTEAPDRAETRRDETKRRRIEESRSG